MKISVSNLAFPRGDVLASSSALVEIGISGIEIAPTLLWPEAPKMDSDISAYYLRIRDSGLEVSGIQSLLYGYPEYQLLNPETWRDLRNHLRGMLHLGAALGASVAVFGSPKNRIRGELPLQQANHIAAEFFSSLLPDLESTQIILTLEPNAPAYGCDYLIRYRDVVEVSALVNSPFVQPQIDTGCLSMVHDEPASAVHIRQPGHVHVSAAHLLPPNHDVAFDNLAVALRSAGYERWVTLEMLQFGDDPTTRAIECCRWISNVFGNVDDE